MQIVGVLDGEMSRRDFRDASGLGNSEHFGKAYLLPAIGANLAELAVPDKPCNSTARSQRAQDWIVRPPEVS